MNGVGTRCNVKFRMSVMRKGGKVARVRRDDQDIGYLHFVIDNNKALRENAFLVCFCCDCVLVLQANHLNRAKQKLENELDELEDSLEREKKRVGDVEKARRKVCTRNCGNLM